MAEQYSAGNAELEHHKRFVDLDTEPFLMLSPIEGYETKPLVSLEEAIKPLLAIVHQVEKRAKIAKERCKTIKDNELTLDEAASLMLYTMDWEPSEKCLYSVLNATLRSAQRKGLVPWFSYLKLILTAYNRLPSSKETTIYLGIKKHWTQLSSNKDNIIWWGFSSCTTSLDTLENDQFMGKTGERTLFIIKSTSGKNIEKYSSFPNESEVVLAPGRLFKVRPGLSQEGGLYIIELKEEDPPFPLLEPLPESIHQISDTDSSISKTTNNLIVSQTSTKSNGKSTVSEFAPSGKFKQQFCKGRLCAHCGRCRDWFYTGSLNSLRWIQNVEIWKSADWKVWSDNRFWEYFKRRDDAQCSYTEFRDELAGVLFDHRFGDFLLGRDRFFWSFGPFW